MRVFTNFLSTRCSMLKNILLKELAREHEERGRPRVLLKYPCFHGVTIWLPMFSWSRLEKYDCRHSPYSESGCRHLLFFSVGCLSALDPTDVGNFHAKEPYNSSTESYGKIRHFFSKISPLFHFCTVSRFLYFFDCWSNSCKISFCKAVR